MSLVRNHQYGYEEQESLINRIGGITTDTNDENSDVCGGDAGNGGKYTLNIYTPDEDAERDSLGQSYIPGEPVITALPEATASEETGEDDEAGKEESEEEDDSQCQNYGVIVSTSVELSDDICTNPEKEYWKENE